MGRSVMAKEPGRPMPGLLPPFGAALRAAPKDKLTPAHVRQPRDERVSSQDVPSRRGLSAAACTRTSTSPCCPFAQPARDCVSTVGRGRPFQALPGGCSTMGSSAHDGGMLAASRDTRQEPRGKEYQ